MVLSSETIDVFLRVLQRLRNESNQRLGGVEEHAVDTITSYLAGLSSVCLRLSYSNREAFTAHQEHVIISVADSLRYDCVVR
jgi:hypothetical protein